MKLLEAEKYFINRVAELGAMCAKKDPWVFLCSSAFLEYTMKIVEGKDRGVSGYKDLITKYNYFPDKYKTFVYRCGKQDLPEQMYSILRCGLVHSFSLKPIKPGPHGRLNSISLCHKCEADTKNLHHLQNYYGINGDVDSALFVAEDFVCDIRNAINSIFVCAKTYPSCLLASNIESWLSICPPVSGDF